ncbi:hypothetical protein L596_025720 [Steinernema carpocapsae]|uniref:Uncharacterized protein n=1 Tax=Steinernema carpocapsae TaxID=34508 RepID=A0A4U5M8M5_STECR|nr:hypothetical protein L596_025720 [Steinernema carpocapsae]
MSTYEIKHFDFAVCDLCQAAHKKPNSKYDNAVEWWLNGTCLNRHTSDEVELSWISNYGLIVLLLIVFVAISGQDAHKDSIEPRLMFTRTKWPEIFTLFHTFALISVPIDPLKSLCRSANLTLPSSFVFVSNRTLI